MLERGDWEIISLCYIHDADTRKLHKFLIDTFKHIINTGKGVGKCQTNYFDWRKYFTEADLGSSVCLIYQKKRLTADLMSVYKYLNGKKM